MRIQDIISDLSDQLNRPVALNDFDLNLVAASAQNSEVDDYRVQSILARRTPSEVVELLRENGYLERARPFLLPENILPGLQSRLCLPIRVNSRNIAFLWIVLQTEQQLTTEEYYYARQAAQRITDSFIDHPFDPGVDEVVDDTHLLQQLIHTDLHTASYAIAEWAAEQEIGNHSAMAISVMPLVLKPERHEKPKNEAPTLPLQNDFRYIVHLVKSVLNKGDLFALIADALVVVSTHSKAIHTPKLVENALLQSGGKVSTCVRASGTSLTHEWQYGLREAYLEAAYTSRIAGKIMEVPKHGIYDQLGPLILFRNLAWTEQNVALISPEAAALRAQGHHTNIQTILAFLRQGGDIIGTCNVLKIHRSTLYYRLDRCREVIGDALDHGWQRASLYLGIVLSELIDSR